MAARGEKGDTGRVGDQGRVGDPGATGDTGPAGDAGPTGDTGDVGPKGIAGNVAADHRLLWLAVLFTVGFVFLATVVLWNQTRISHQATELRQQNVEIQQVVDRLEHVVYEQCADRNKAAVTKNGLLDQAIAAEKRRTNPSAKTLKDLAAFKDAVPDCGPKP